VGTNTRAHVTPIAALVALAGAALLAQGIARDDGHCATPTSIVVACWNGSAGNGIAENIANYPEFLPNLHGWDFRINLPHVRFQTLGGGDGSPIAMAGVVEDAGPLYKPSSGRGSPIPQPIVEEPATFDYAHRDNAIWMFRTDGASGRMFFSMLPSRRDRQTGAVENVSTLTGGWLRVGPATGPLFSNDRIAAAVVGRGLGSTTIHLVARGRDSKLYWTRLAITAAHVTSWPAIWRALNVDAATAPSLGQAGANRLVLAWTDPAANVMAQELDTLQNTWTPAVRIAEGAELHQPLAVWDGTTVNVLFTSHVTIRHAIRTSTIPLVFSAPANVFPLLPVHQGQFDVMFFNRALHAAIHTDTGSPPGTAVFYATTKSAPGAPPAWTIPSETGLQADDTPRIAHLAEDVFVMASDPNGRVTYARKDPNRVDNRITGGAFSDTWLSAGTDIDPPTTGSIRQLTTFAFNSDLYVTGRRATGSVLEGVIVNFGRAAMKGLFGSKWGMALRYAEGAGGVQSVPSFGGANEIRMVGDFTGDGVTDLVRFPQLPVPNAGDAPVFVRFERPQVDHLLFSSDSPWHPSFSSKGQVPGVGDFDGDGKDDIVNFVQHDEPPVVLGRRGRARGDVRPFGGPPVYVALSNGSSFGQRQRWHTDFSPAGEIPLVGDFNGDGKDDIVSFAQHPQAQIGNAPVRVALSNGQSFGAASVWQTDFSPAGEIPMVGDFNGDGKADIVSFARRAQFAPDGTMIGHAPVRVALSTGTSFGPSRIWHTFFSLDGEIPRVADVNLDGKADIVTFLHGTGDGVRKNNVYVAFSTGTRFETSVTWMSDQAPAGTTPFIGSASGTSTLFNLTQRPQDRRTFLPDLFVFDDATGRLAVAEGMGRIPYAVGAPWERYRFFTPKGLGAAMFPEWIFENGPSHCLTQPFRFILNGAAGVGGADAFVSSVRQGGGTGHVFEEMSHSLFANCLRQNRDPFHIFDLIFNTSMDAGGLDAKNMPGCDGAFDDCRDPEHFFIQLARRYRIAGDLFRHRILAAPTPDERRRRLKQYLWIKEHWYHGAEFKLGVQEDVSVYPEGVLCLPGECSLTGPVVNPG
jgi:hypothetical protein